MARPRKPPTVNRYDDAKARRRPFYVHAYPGNHRRAFTFAERDEAEAFVRDLSARGHNAAAAAYDARAVAAKRFQGGKAEALTLADLALEYAESRPKASTRLAYVQQARYLAEFPATASRDLADLTPADMTAYLEFLRARPNGRGGTMSVATIRLAWTIARSVLDRAVRRGLIPANPVRAVEDQPRAPRTGTDDLTSRAITEREFLAIADRLPDTVRPLYDVLWGSGLRIGEALALRWADVQPMPDDPEVVEVFVSRSLTAAATRGTPGAERWSTGTTKSGRARRVHVHVSAFDRLERGEPGALVFARSRDTYTNAWTRARDKAAAAGEAHPSTRIHDLRHSRVTRLLSERESPYVVAAEMGHASAAFTMDRYAHAIPSDAVRVGRIR